MKARYFAFRYDLLRHPALRAFTQTPAGVTLRFLMARATPRIESLRPGSDILELREVFP